MHFNLLDLFVVAYVVYGIIRGRQRGLPRELPKLLGVTVAVLTGAGLFHWTGKALNAAQLVTRQSVGLTGSVAIVIAAFLLVRHFKAKIRDWTARRCPDQTLQRRAGAAAGGLRTLVIGCFVIVFLGLLPFNPFKAPFARGSFFGRNLIRFVVPVYNNVAGESPNAH